MVTIQMVIRVRKHKVEEILSFTVCVKLHAVNDAYRYQDQIVDER